MVTFIGVSVGAKEAPEGASVCPRECRVSSDGKARGARLTSRRGGRAAGPPEGGLVGVTGGLGGAPLRLAVTVDRRAVLGADVIALARPLRRVVALPEQAQQLAVAHDARLAHDEPHPPPAPRGRAAGGAAGGRSGRRGRAAARRGRAAPRPSRGDRAVSSRAAWRSPPRSGAARPAPPPKTRAAAG